MITSFLLGPFAFPRLSFAPATDGKNGNDRTAPFALKNVLLDKLIRFLQLGCINAEFRRPACEFRNPALKS
jgi:hypothetical protein